MNPDLIRRQLYYAVRKRKNLVARLTDDDAGEPTEALREKWKQACSRVERLRDAMETALATR